MSNYIDVVNIIIPMLEQDPQFVRLSQEAQSEIAGQMATKVIHLIKSWNAEITADANHESQLCKVCDVPTGEGDCIACQAQRETTEDWIADINRAKGGTK